MFVVNRRKMIKVLFLIHLMCESEKYISKIEEYFMYTPEPRYPTNMAMGGAGTAMKGVILQRFYYILHIWFIGETRNILSYFKKLITQSI